ncbi:clathrin light chain-like isoform X2 [Dermatophagoides pteronyssinus]|uniref:Uncharacterized protein n=2 Tax=Dermatophagoides pteronyssinus TaxID=6956 RepID=A0ABQ8JGJ6_DERPT|nr:clathrin light chain-like isoform X2 [Dermatophagoides pteronyssinus]KAH9421723.1 hypothetical protein DERP_002010 [Dermatophagoides pteronyssinus]
MSDLEITDSSAVTGSNDLVAEFLAREQSVLGEIDDDFNKDGQITATLPSSTNDDLFDSDDIKLNGDFNESQPANGEIDNLSNGILEVSLEKSTTGNNADPPQSMMMNQPIIPAEEPESIKRWREQHVKNLELKDQEEKEKIEELRKQAKKELEEWYKRYHEEVEKTKKQNRAAEKEWIAERDNEQPASNGQAWEKINRMCDFNPKTSRNTRDTSRMRSILLQLKQNPPASSSSMSGLLGGQSAS